MIDLNSFEARSLAIELEGQYLKRTINMECITYCPEEFVYEAMEILMAKYT